MTEAEKAYIAGFWEGEGYAGVTPNGYGRINIHQKDDTALLYIQKLLGAGHIYYRPADGGVPYLSITKRSDVRRFVRLTYKYVRSPRKKQQLRRAFQPT